MEKEENEEILIKKMFGSKKGRNFKINLSFCL